MLLRTVLYCVLPAIALHLGLLAKKANQFTFHAKATWHVLSFSLSLSSSSFLEIKERWKIQLYIDSARPYIDCTHTYNSLCFLHNPKSYTSKSWPFVIWVFFGFTLYFTVNEECWDWSDHGAVIYYYLFALALNSFNFLAKVNELKHFDEGLTLIISIESNSM